MFSEPKQLGQDSQETTYRTGKQGQGSEERIVLQNVELQNVELQNAEFQNIPNYKTSNLTERQNKKSRKYMYSTLYEKFPWAFLPENSVIEEVVVPYRHGGGWSKKINAWYLNTLMVYL
jgi:hypothetical protein